MSRRRTKYSNNHRKTRSQAVYGTQTGAPCVSGSTSKPSVSEEFEVACRENKRKIARQLLEDFSAEALEPLSKPDVQIRANALTWACCVGLVDIVQTIFELLPPSALGAVQPAFARACHYGQHEVVELFFQYFPDKVCASAHRELSEACRNGRIRVVKLYAKVFPDETSSAIKELDQFDGTTPLYWACRNGFTDIVRLLLKQFPVEVHGALQLRDIDDKTPVSWACSEGHEEVVSLLLAQLTDSLEVSSDEPDEVTRDFADDSLPEMVYGASRETLSQQGYRMVGSHSAVKQCRWTRNALRGQGQCYKHTFYGISSHRCMEGTPSLACANKCTFCWRNHANPVATSWTYKTDSPDYIVQESVRNHLELVSHAAHSPLALPDRVDEAHGVRHMALSLVGEPVLYPEMPAMVHELHRRRISTFLVTNGQFPEQLEQLPWVTQLYVSVDAANPSDLKEVGRPLFRDYWERLRRSLAILHSKQPWQRSVCRMTVIKGKNMQDKSCEGYAELVNLAQSDFVELKGATAAAWDDAKANLSVANAPRHEDVVDFAHKLNEFLPDYGVACEHKHSCSVLLARRDRFFNPTGSWRTWIDFEKFADAAITGTPLEVTEFTQETPEWALAGSSDYPGFDPAERRRYRKIPERLKLQQLG